MFHTQKLFIEIHVLILTLVAHSKLRALIGLRDALGNFLLYQNSSLFTLTFGEKVLTVAKSHGS